jgi:hypothetical protein
LLFGISNQNFCIMAEPIPKSKKKKSKKPVKEAKVKVEHNYCDDLDLDENLAVIKFELCLECPIYKEKALEIYNSIIGQFPRRSFQLLTNIQLDGKAQVPRFGAFEIFFAKTCNQPPHLVWSGIEMGPPRRDKFPNESQVEEIIKKVEKLLIQK